MWKILLLIPALVGAGELTFADFEVQKDEGKWWRSEDGVIYAGSPTEKVSHNTFATTKKRFSNFELRLQVKLEAHQSKNPNAGIQIRSERIPNHHEMIGYQADMGKNYWGKLYDESRRRKIVGDYVSDEAKSAVRDGWNDYRIRCEGPRIRLWLNGILTVDFTEKDENIPLEGLIALQAHSGAPFEACYRKIEIDEIPKTEGIMTWGKLGPSGVKTGQ
ncbi:MAG: 3-keto-disaccharide hydrolase [Verrucomicrobiaceae bacterium]